MAAPATKPSPTHAQPVPDVGFWGWVTRIGALLGILVVLLGALAYIIHAEIGAAISPLQVALASHSADIQNLKTQVDSLRKLPASFLKESTVNLETADDFRRASRFVDVAMRVQSPSTSEALKPIQRQINIALLKKRSDKDAYTAATAALVRSFAYESFSNNLNQKNFVGVFDHVTISNFGGGISIAPGAKAEIVVFESSLINVKNQDLTSIKWVQTTFRNVNVTYNGGPIFLADVRFEGCTFSFGKDAESQRLKERIDANPLSVTAYVNEGQVFIP